MSTRREPKNGTNIKIPEQILRREQPGRKKFTSKSSDEFHRSSYRYRCNQLNAMLKRRETQSKAFKSEVDKATDAVELVSSFLFLLAREENATLDVINDTDKVKSAAETRLNKCKQEIVEALMTFL